MKAASLFHLMQLRLQGLSAAVPDQCRIELAEIQRDLRVAHSRDFFEIGWRFRGKDFSLSVADREFGFHIAGDSALAVTRRGAADGTRSRNWTAAAELWRRMAAISGVPVPENAFVAALAPGPARPGSADGHVPAIGAAVAAAAVGVVVTVFAGLEAAAGAALVTALLCGTVHFLEGTHLRQRASAAEIALIAVGVLASLGTTGTVGSVAPLLSGMVLAAWLEHSSTRSWALWAVAGLLLGGSALTFGWPGAFGALGLSAATLLAGWAAPAKIDRRAAVALSMAAVAVVGAAALSGRVAAPVGAGNAVAWLATAGLFVGFVLWWIQGALFHVMPWLAMGALCLAAAIAVATGQGGAGVMALSGYAALLIWRLARGFFGVARG